MRNLKKVLALVLALVMSMSLVTIANASDFADADDITYEEAVDVLTALGVIEGVGNNTFNPTGNVTRAQMAKMITIISLGNVEPDAFLGTTTDLTDIDGHWAEAYIKYCYSQGIIAGKGNGIFDPNANVTSAEAAKMLLVAIGYNSDVQGYTGSQWTINVTRDAQTSKFYEDLSVPANQDLTRDQAAQLIYNAVQAPIIEKRSTVDRDDGTISDSYIPNEDKSLLTETFEAKIFIGTFDGNYNTGDAAKGEIQITGNLTTDNTVAGSVGYVAPKSADFPCDLDIKYIGEQFKVIYKEGTSGSNGQPDKNDTIYGVFNTGKTTVYTITKGDLQDAGTDNLNKGKIKFNDTLHDVAAFAADADVAIVTNYGAAANVTAAAIDTAVGGNDMTGCSAVDFATYINTNLRVRSADTIKFVCNDQGEIYRAYVEQWTYSKLASVTSTKVQLEGVGSYDAEDVNYIDEVAVDDLVATAEFYGNVMQVQVKAAETVSGTVEATSGTKIQIDGTWYNSSVNAEGLTDYNVTTFAVGDSYEIVLDGAYYVVGKVITANVDYAIVQNRDTGINDQVKLLKADGTSQVYVINTDSVLQYAGVAIDDLVKYEEVKDGTEVKMSAVSSVTDAASAEVHSYNKDSKVLTVYNGTTAANYVASDTAVAFVYSTAEAKWKAFNANTVSAISAGNATEAQYVLKDGKVVAFALTTVNFPTGSGSSLGYGYVTDVVNTKVNDSNVVKLTVWNGTEDYTVVVDGSAAPAAKGDFVQYLISDAAIAAADVKSADYSSYNFAEVKVKEYDSARNLVITTTGRYTLGGTIVDDVESVYVVDNNTQIIGVNTADLEGSSYNTITAFTKVAGKDYNNAYIISETDGAKEVIKAIFVDEDNAITNYAGGVAVPPVGAATVVSNAADVTTALSGNNYVVFNGDLSVTNAIATALTGSKTLVVNGTVTLTDATVSLTGGTLIANTVVLNGKTLTGSGEVIVNGTLVMGSTISGSVKVTAASATLASDKTMTINSGSVTINGTVTGGGTLSVSGGTVAVTGAVTADVTVTGGTVTTGAVTGDVTASGSATVTTGAVTGDVTASGSADVTTGAVSGETNNTSTGDVSTGGTTNYAPSILLRGEGPGKDGLENFAYGTIYSNAGVTLDGTTLKVNVDTLKTWAESNTGTDYQSQNARYHLTQLSGELDGAAALFVGIAFGAPEELESVNKVKVSVNGGTATTYDLTSNSVDGAGNDVLGSSFIKYLPFASGDAETAPGKIADMSYSFTFEWMNAEGTVLGTSSCVISRVSTETAAQA